MSWPGLGVVFVGALSLFNLILMYGVVRRLRTHSELLAASRPPLADDLPLKSTVDPFAVTTVDGAALDANKLGSRALVGFFSPGCDPCQDLLPRFVAVIERERLRADDVLAVIADGDADGQETYLTALRSIATVVRDDGDTVAHAFGVQAYPTVCRVDGSGSVTALDRTLRSVSPAPARV